MSSATITPRNQIEGLPTFRLKSEVIADGHYKIKCAKEEEAHADGPAIESKLWFKSPPLDPVSIRRLNSIRLYAESHDQGFADDVEGGNWTWLELAIYENEDAEIPRKKGGIDLVWLSHPNAFLTEEFQWCEGRLFPETHDLIRSLEDGNVIGVRLCARFAGWEIRARNGYLVIDIGDQTLDREPPPPYHEVVSQVNIIQEAFNDINISNRAAFTPSISDTLFRADAFGTANERPLRVLSLDGGGVRGLLSLKLLKTVMDKTAPGKKPCEVFDMIGGTSTGGLIAIMLGRLQLTIDECIGQYKKVMGKVFPEGSWKKTRFAFKGEFYDEKPLEQAIKDIVKLKLGSEDAMLHDPNDTSPCKIFVMAVRKDAANNRGPEFLRSYVNDGPGVDKPDIPEIKIWQAARATSAAPAYFKPLEVKSGDRTYELLDGGLGANNPLGWLWTELLSVFGPARATDCFLSIGTGIPPNVNMPRPSELTKAADTMNALASIATNQEIVNVLFRTLVNAFAPKPTTPKYFRLNIGTKIPDWDEKTGILGFGKPVHHMDDFAPIGDMDDVANLPNLEKVTDQYVKDNKDLIEACARAMKVSLEEA